MPMPWWTQFPGMQQQATPTSTPTPTATPHHPPIAGESGYVARPKTQEEFDALPDGTWYIEPEDGQMYMKGNKFRNPKANPPVD